MMPVAEHIPVIKWKEKRSTDCDFIARFGSGLSAVRIEVTVFYRRRPWPKPIVESWKFSARRDDTGKFIWDYGSIDAGIFDLSVKTPIMIIPFSSNCAPFSPEKSMEDMKSLTTAIKITGRPIIWSTMLDCKPANSQ
jgi:hypothetical protein